MQLHSLAVRNMLSGGPLACATHLRHQSYRIQVLTPAHTLRPQASPTRSIGTFASEPISIHMPQDVTSMRDVLALSLQHRSDLDAAHVERLTMRV